MLVEAAPDEADRNSVFGFLHALDIGGGALAGVYVLIAVIEHVAFSWIFLASALPLVVATFSLTFCTTGRAVPKHVQPSRLGSSEPERGRLPGAVPLLAASALFGFTYYSVGFPILTIAQGSGDRAFGIGAFLLFNAVSAATGYLMGPRLGSRIAERFRALGAFGYLFAVVGAVLLAIGDAAHLTVAVLLVGVAALGFSLGIVTTVEPALMSVLRPGRQAGRGFGALGAARSVGLFLGNLIMGFLYARGADWAYGYAAVMGMAATIVVLGSIPAARRADGRVRSQAGLASDER
jgi:MFS family permease